MRTDTLVSTLAEGSSPGNPPALDQTVAGVTGLPRLPGTNVRVTHGSHEGYFLVADKTVASVRKCLASVFSIPAEAVAMVNGQVVGPAYILGEREELAFAKEKGRKGVGEHVWSGEQFCKVFQITSEDLDAWITQGLKAKRCLDGSIRITETAADEFVRGRVIESGYFTVEEAAWFCRTSEKGIYAMIEAGKLKKCPGSRKCLFTKEMLDAAMMGEE
jgi:hypothetical protein